MKWSLNELRQTADEPLMFEETLDLKASLQKRRPEILDVSPVLVKGVFSVDELGVLGYAKVKTTVTLPSTRSLEPAEVDLEFEFTEHYVSHHERDLSRFEDTDVVIVLENDILDLNSVIEDNILLQIPMQVLTKAEQAHIWTFFVWNEALESYERVSEIHHERTYELEVYQRLLTQAGFKDITVSADFGKGELTSETTRWFFSCHK